ncbi:MAG TPA: membrane protein insertase YidC, partial [Spirochaetes bacterium]|nr:membrane protein insertase YidC [Spirochaetota bacterium]
MEKRALIAVVLSLGIWLIWSYFFMPQQQPVKETPPVKTEEPLQPVKKELPPKKTANLEARGVAREQTLTLDTGVYELTLSSRGASISGLTYSPRKTRLVVEKNPFNARGVFDFSMAFSEDDFLVGSDLDRVNWNMTRLNDTTVLFSAVIKLDGAPVRVEKKYTFIQNAENFKISYTITNLSRRNVNLPNGYVLISPADFLGPDMDFSNTYNQIHGMYYIDNDFEKVTKGGGLFSKNGPLKRQSGRTQWVGVMSRYFLLILIPEDFTGTGTLADSRKETGFRTGMYIPLDTIKAGQEFTKSFKVYVGEKDKKKLAVLGETLTEAADVSKWIEPIRDFLLWSLLKINILFGNLGWSLVVFSLITKVILLPLTMKSTESMKKLQALNPQMTEIREKFKDKPEVMNKKIMELYKKNKVNPASGCLPILVQMPFFFALYSALINSIDLWQAPFILWIKDLSLP